MEHNTTICALSSAPGRGAISVIRMSGPDSVKILSESFSHADRLEHSKMVLGTLNADTLRDRVLAVVFYAPDSYTGEDVAEVHCHGSPEIVNAVLRKFVRSGARYAQPGEFTRRAFESGK